MQTSPSLVEGRWELGSRRVQAVTEVGTATVPSRPTQAHAVTLCNWSRTKARCSTCLLRSCRFCRRLCPGIGPVRSNDARGAPFAVSERSRNDKASLFGLCLIRVCLLQARLVSSGPSDDFSYQGTVAQTPQSFVSPSLSLSLSLSLLPRLVGVG